MEALTTTVASVASVVTLITTTMSSKDYYISKNKKLLNMCNSYNINIKSVQVLNRNINKLKRNGHILLTYKENKRYFPLLFYNNKKKDRQDKEKEEEYNWLEEEKNSEFSTK